MSEFKHPIDPANGRFLCSATNPMPPAAPGRWSHTNVRETGEERDFGGGECRVRMRCADCGHSWWQELPQ